MSPVKVTKILRDLAKIIHIYQQWPKNNMQVKPVIFMDILIDMKTRYASDEVGFVLSYSEPGVTVFTTTRVTSLNHGWENMFVLDNEDLQHKAAECVRANDGLTPIFF